MNATRAKHTRNRKSRIKRLPKPIKTELDRLIREDRMSQADILKEVNTLCEKHGEDKVSQSSLSRYQKQADRIMAKTRELKEISAVWVDRLGDEPVSNIGRMLQQIVHTLAIEVGMKLEEQEVPDLKAINQLALVTQRVERAARDSLKREQEMRTAFAEEAADKAGEALANQGMTASTIETIKKEILGIA
ncbi:DUF3486 family protein [Endozoicomonas gorgoniicola]|uniref:DUF3486 family protein n=1 Tax=Endozoicomonas gorgoniicola TaxID=1234144 RepID=A0ABT3MT67_9GAMM|nr:DUF3486 family protein [Endozoicomonas gorgoniicola]MCW7552577.1 DUF3486 family protein [Endozoicomonas gorgoniicola]